MKIHLCPVAFALLAISILKAQADDGTWLPNPADNDWINSANWSSGTVPGIDDLATFAQSAVTSVTAVGPLNVGGIVFAQGSSSYVLTLSGPA